MDKNNNELLERVNDFKNEYYNNQSKNLFFKKSQKMDMAKQLSQSFDLNELLRNFTYNIPNTSNIYLDYTIFKLFANESNYQMIIDYFLNIIDYCIYTYGEYNIHLNMESFTVSAAERYYGFLELYVNNCLMKTKTNHFLYSEKLKNFYIYNPPSVLDMVHKIFRKVIQKEVNEKFVVIPKKDSKVAIEKLLDFSSEKSSNIYENL
jgi:hypothetical protein